MANDMETTSLEELTHDTAGFLDRLRHSGQPSLLTRDGRPAVVVMDPAAWQVLHHRLEEAETVAALREGLAQADAGEGVPADAFLDSVMAGRS